MPCQENEVESIVFFWFCLIVALSEQKKISNYQIKKNIKMSQSKLLELQRYEKEDQEALDLCLSLAIFWKSSGLTNQGTNTENLFLLFLIYYEPTGEKRDRMIMGFPLRFLTKLLKNWLPATGILPRHIFKMITTFGSQYDYNLDVALREGMQKEMKETIRLEETARLQSQRHAASELYESSKLFMMHKKWTPALENLLKYKQLVDKGVNVGKDPAEDKHLLYLSMCHHNAQLEGLFPAEDGLVTASPNIYIDMFIDWMLKYPPAEKLKLPAYVTYQLQRRKVVF